MTDVDELQERFATPNVPLSEDVLGELESMLRIHNITPSELFFKWESYAIKMGSDNVKLNLQTARDFKKDIHEALERETRSKQAKSNERRPIVGATPRAARGGDLYGLIDGVSPTTPRLPMAGVNGNSVKRRGNFDTPASKTSKTFAGSTPHGKDSPMNLTVPFTERQHAGEIVETLNDHIPAAKTRDFRCDAPRIKLKANTELQKFAYKPMAMKLNECSEILDDRIEAFVELVQEMHELEDGAFGNPTVQSANEIVAVGRIASDTGDGKLNPSSIVFETSRRSGGVRIPLKVDSVSGFDFFSGRIVALRGTNPSGDYFMVKDILEIPLLDPHAVSPEDLEEVSDRVTQSDDAGPLNVIISAGPYTADSNLDFEPLHALCEKALNTSADALILLGPFLDSEHPLVVSGEFPPFPPSLNVNPDTATVTDVFRASISLPLARLAAQLPQITIVMVPSTRDVIQKHISWPQDRLKRADFGLPKQVSIVTNPIMIRLNETLFGISSQDVLGALRQESCIGGTVKTHGPALLERLSRNVIEQRHFYPVFPPPARDTLPKPTAHIFESVEGTLPSGAMLDISYLALGDWQGVRPDVLILPSVLAPFAKVVESVVCINPGMLSKKRGAGSFAQMTIEPRVLEEREQNEPFVANKLYDRARVDVVRI